MNETLLFPNPREVRVLDVDERHAHPVSEIHDESLPGQGFALTVDRASAVLRYADDAGLRYGRQTIEQLRDASGLLPTVDLRDHPDLPVRGFMLDVSRDRVPTRETLDRLVTVLETCRFNHLQLYVEHTFAYVGHDEVWSEASPLTPQDLTWLRDRCAAAGIELAANQNCFGHFARWLSHAGYRERAECPDGFELLPGVDFPPTVLAPTPDNASFAVGLAREQAAAFDARIVNVGCDETFELGRGVSRARVEAEGPTAVYAEHLRRIVEPLLADGFQVQFWGDVIAHHPEHLDLIPTTGSTALVWNYDAPDAPKVELPESLRGPLAEIGIDLAADTRFAERLQPFAEAGLSHWVCPGASSWNSLVGRIENARSNILDAVSAGLRSGAGGMLLTDWGDGGHHQPLTVSYPPIAYAGAVAWCADANAGLDTAAVIDRYLLGDETHVLGDLLDRIGRVATRTGLIAANASPLVPGVVHGGVTFRNGTVDHDGIRDVMATLRDAIDEVGRARPSCAQAAAIVEELSVAIALAAFGAESLAGSAGLTIASPAERATQLEHLIERYRNAWLMTSRPGGLDDSAAHLLATVDELRGEQL